MTAKFSHKPIKENIDNTVKCCFCFDETDSCDSAIPTSSTLMGITVQSVRGAIYSIHTIDL